MRRGRVCGITVLGTVSGIALLFCGSASAMMTQAIALQEPTPANAEVGKSINEPGESSVGLAVRLTTETPSVCVLSYYSAEATHGKPMWTLDFVSGGTCTVIAVQAGNTEYEAAEARLSFSVYGPTVVPTGETGPRALPGHKPPSALQRETIRKLKTELKACKEYKLRSKREACEKHFKKRYGKKLASERKPSDTAPGRSPAWTVAAFRMPASLASAS